MAESIVEVKQGKLKGKIGEDYKGGKYYSFHGIPYAAPPIGNLRFKRPVPPNNWEGIRDATKEPSESISRHFILRENIVGSEDCLYLNIYTPQIPQTNNETLKPVMFWIHGGGFFMGSSKTDLYGPDYLITGDVVVVTVNYRLGILGVLSLQDPTLEVTGNAGLKDIVQALKWIQENVEKFGGDPNNVTIFGESAGAAATHLLILSPMTKGLFHRAILQSGCALNPWVYGRNIAREVAEILGFESNDEKEILNFLQKIPSDKFLEAQDKINSSIGGDQLNPFGITIEESSNNSAFITEQPIDIILSGNYNKVPMIIGFTDREGMVTECSHKRIFGKLQVPENLETRIPHYYNVEKNSELAKNIANKIRKFYYGDSSNVSDKVDEFFKLDTDLLFWRGIYVTIQNHLENLNLPIYLYRITVNSDLNLIKKLANFKHQGVCHCDEIGYIFKTQFLDGFKPNSLEERSVHRFVTLWTNFAKSGDPNPAINDPLIESTWKPVQKETLNFLNIGETLTSDINPDTDRMKLWDNLSADKNINSLL